MRDLHHLGPDLGHDQGHKFDPISKSTSNRRRVYEQNDNDQGPDLGHDLGHDQAHKFDPISKTTSNRCRVYEQNDNEQDMTKDLT